MKKIFLLFGAFLFAVISLQTGNNHANAAVAPPLEFTGLIISWKQEPDTADKLMVRVKEKKNEKWTGWHEIKGDADADEKDGLADDDFADGKFENLFSTNLSTDYEYKTEGAAKESAANGANPQPGISEVQIDAILSDRAPAPLLFAELNIPLRPRVISRSRWGANEEITFEQQDAQNGSG